MSHFLYKLWGIQDLYFCIWISIYSKQHFLKILQSNYLCIFVKNKLTVFVSSISQFSILFHWHILSSVLFCLDYSNFIMSWNQLVFQLHSFLAGAGAFVLSLWAPLPFHINFEQGKHGSSTFARSLFWDKRRLHWLNLCFKFRIYVLTNIESGSINI